MPPRRKSPRKVKGAKRKKPQQEPAEDSPSLEGDQGEQSSGGGEAAPQEPAPERTIIITAADVHERPESSDTESETVQETVPVVRSRPPPGPPKKTTKPRKGRPPATEEDEACEEEEIQVLNKILDFYEEHPHHYDLSQRDYKDERKKERELNELADSLGPDWTGEYKFNNCFHLVS